MVAQESSGVDLLPNGLNDGGFGLCHMQPVVAQSFGLNVYERCKEMVCKKHGIKLKSILMENNSDRKTVITYDDRLHPILNLDAVGRMLASYMSGKRVKGLGPFRTAICRYAGKYNYEKYWQHVKRYMIKLEDQSYLQRLEESFNKLNPSFTIDGKKADFDLYIQVCQQQNYNYGLGTYKNLPKYLPRNSNKVLRTYKKFL
jgi:hypothetical protein